MTSHQTMVGPQSPDAMGLGRPARAFDESAASSNGRPETIARGHCAASGRPTHASAAARDRFRRDAGKGGRCLSSGGSQWNAQCDRSAVIRLSDNWRGFGPASFSILVCGGPETSANHGGAGSSSPLAAVTGVGALPSPAAADAQPIQFRPRAGAVSRSRRVLGSAAIAQSVADTCSHGQRRPHRQFLHQPIDNSAKRFKSVAAHRNRPPVFPSHRQPSAKTRLCDFRAAFAGRPSLSLTNRDSERPIPTCGRSHTERSVTR